MESSPELKAASVSIVLSNLLLLLILPLVILRDQLFTRLDWIKESLENVEKDFLFAAMRLDLLGFGLLGLVFFNMWRKKQDTTLGIEADEPVESQMRYLYAALSLWLWIPVRYVFQLDFESSEDISGFEVDIFPWFFLSTILLSISGITRIHRWYVAFTILNFIGVMLIFVSSLAGVIIKAIVVPLFAINAAVSMYFIDKEKETGLDYWVYFRKTRI